MNDTSISNREINKNLSLIKLVFYVHADRAIDFIIYFILYLAFFIKV